MHINDFLVKNRTIEINIELAKQSILKRQKSIYIAAKKYNLKEILRNQRKLLLNNNLLLIAIYRFINLLKKKQT